MATSGPAHAEEISPAIYLMVDTSGSMVFDQGGTACRGDGSLEHPHTAGCSSRIYMAKNAISTVVDGYPEVRWGLARFHQTIGWNHWCTYQTGSTAPASTVAPCSAGTPGSPWELDINGNPLCVPSGSFSAYQVSHDLVGNDRMCINYLGDCNGADILVALAETNETQIQSWVNHQEPAGQWFSTTHPVTGDHCWDPVGGKFGDCELRGTYSTPLGASLQSLFTQISQTDLNNDPRKGCRPYVIVLLTDGDEGCGGNPSNLAASLRQTPDVNSTCNTDADCPINSWCNTATHDCTYEVLTYVIGFNFSSAALDSIAFNGGTELSISALNEDDIVAAMADIIANASHPELCNGVDDNCNTEVDEGYPVGDACENGLLGECHRTGSYACDPVDPTGVVCDAEIPAPISEVCDGLDNNCDGLVDEDDVCCSGPELCNGADDYCGQNPSLSDGDEDARVWLSPGVRRPCGTDVGVCELGESWCLGGQVACQGGTGPEPVEQCDTLDRNCNGLPNDVAPEACVIMNANGSCPGVQICELPGAWSACMGQPPAAETCNNQDENCNGFADEGLDYPIWCGAGVCLHSVIYCVGGVESLCDPMLGSGPETCNGLDDDCNGAVDDGLGTSTCGFGVCLHTVPNCLSGSPNLCDPMQGWSAEVCNNLDDDCDGVVDDGLVPRVCYPAPTGCTEGPPGTWTCQGVCATGTQSCLGGSWRGCVGAQTPVPEICDGLDNDCNGPADDGLGSTWCGLGVCLHEQPNCVSGSLVVCNPLQGASVETCNGVDDDCDGLVDDGVTRNCYPEATLGCEENPPGSGSYSCLGDCQAGVEACVQDATGIWSGVCQGTTMPLAEVCDGRDNDCDGTVDDNVTRPCYPFGSGCVARADGTGYDCDGVCAAGAQTCVEGGTGTWGGCVNPTGPGVEDCNGLDDDCDGDTDEDAQGQPLSEACVRTNASGTCSGMRICTGGGWDACSATEPGPEAWADPDLNPAVCDTIDQDCNGIVNDGVPPRDCSITNGFGTCPGTATCTAQGTWVNCTAKVPQNETCNGVDDDCDGFVDEDAAGNALTQACYSGPVGTEGVGVCRAGVRTCTSGGWGSCVGQVIPTPEVCNGLDNDCDGTPDDGLGTTWCGLGACLHEQPNCVSGSLVACNPLQGASVETCNGVDDDCDGLVDDGVTRNCYAEATLGCEETPPGSGSYSCLGDCQAGVEACVQDATGIWSGVCQGTTTPIAEVCDGRDNDCDGTVDDNVARPCYPFGSGCVARADGTGYDCEGVCASGAQTCVEGGTGTWGGCVNPTGPGVEDCNGLDDDCDGDTDEDAAGQPLAQTCSRTNGSDTCTGMEVCTGGGWGACSAAEPGPEAWADPDLNPAVCDTIDQNCNGIVNDGVPSRDCSITNSFGTCPGTATCTAQGTWVNCTAKVPQAETCNGVDDDCDGLVDEDALGDPLTQSCYGGPIGTDGVGVCRTGVRTCSSGGWGSCVGQVIPTPEVCDGLDNDCNGTADDGLGSTWCGLGACLHEQPNCVSGSLVACNPLQGASTETCNGIDDDCDGLVDDGVFRNCYPEATLGCEETVPGSGLYSCLGECHEGVETCVQDATGIWSGVCQGTTTPVPEVCDGRDNDCDGTVDDNVTRPCYPFGSGCVARADGTGYDCDGVCAAGAQTCVEGGTGTWGGCVNPTGPGVEDCNGLDDDCDGDTDEDAAGQPLSQACSRTNASGTCTGMEVCTGGSWGVCSAMEPGPEAWADPNQNPAVCDTIDQDCNGIVNDGVPPRTCTVTNVHGTCSGFETCTAQGTWVNCTAKVPQAETCNGVDDDCDGLVDEDDLGNPLTQPCYSGPVGTDGVGVCAAGLRSCTAGGWSACVGQVLPTPEVCDGLDNDCDGLVDENAFGQLLVRTCQSSNAWGTCLGSQTCTGTPGDLWTVCTAQTPAEEVCDGQDNNCDGVIDGLSQSCYPFGEGCVPDGSGGFQCQGVCWAGIEICPALPAPAPGNSFGACQHTVGPTFEVCDGLDNDCDGLVDENALGAPLARPCYWPGYGASTGCDAPGSCTGICHEGIETCGAILVGQWGSCVGEVTPGLEVCDATDNDCDGQTDEVEDMPWLGQPCTQDATGDPVCDGIWLCEDGVESCAGGAVEPGRCDGLDNDCDGAIDELDELQQDPVFETACGTDLGECVQGSFECIGGSWACVGQVLPSEEVCDGLDNDCDSLIDNGADCAPVGSRDAYCVEAECRLECDPTSEMPCQPGFECTERPTEQGDQYVCMPVTGNCGGETCPTGWICVDEECVDPCAGVACESWQQCRMGFCVDVSCSAPGGGCPSGEICISHECVEDPCRDSACFDQGGYCVRECDGADCISRCEPLCLCEGTQYCNASGDCVEDPCHGVTCEASQRCNRQSGLCEADPCFNFTCLNQTVCFEGACIEDPCASVACPWPYECSVQPGLNDQGGIVPVTGCERDPSLWLDGEHGDRYLATGGGGCQCDAPGVGPGGGTVALWLLLLGWLFRRRRHATARRRDGGAR